MAKDYPRCYRVADQIQQVLSVLIRDEINDPRLSKMFTISSVEVSRDLSMAKVYYSLMDNSDRSDTEEALSSSLGFMRRRLGKQMSLRSVPQLQFRYDNSIEEGARMSALIAEAVNSNSTEADDAQRSDPDAADHVGAGASSEVGPVLSPVLRPDGDGH